MPEATQGTGVPGVAVTGQTPDEVLAESTQDAEGSWRHKCGNTLHSVRVHHSVHEMPHALAGSGQVQVQTVPFCPSCHTKPSSYGAPITPGMTDWPPVKIMPCVARGDQ